MTTPEKEVKMQVQARELKGLKHKASKMQARLEKFLADSEEHSALPHDNILHSDVSALVSELDDTVQLEPQYSFKRIFWEQQVSEAMHIRRLLTYTDLIPTIDI